ncbi:DUF1731 domain-containing protein [Brevibacillus fluminis]
MCTEPDLALTGRNCVLQRLLDYGFAFRHTNLEETLRDLLRE